MENFTISENSPVDLLIVSGFGIFFLVLNRSSVFKSSLRLFSAEVVPCFLHGAWEKKRRRTNKIEYSALKKAGLFNVLGMLYFVQSVNEGLNWLEREVGKIFCLLDFLEAVENGDLQ